MQAAALQGEDLAASPSQGSPPFSGVGLVQVRVRVFVPSPQVTEQALEGTSLHSPCTGSKGACQENREQ